MLLFPCCFFDVNTHISSLNLGKQLRVPAEKTPGWIKSAFLTKDTKTKSLDMKRFLFGVSDFVQIPVVLVFFLGNTRTKKSRTLPQRLVFLRPTAGVCRAYQLRRPGREGDANRATLRLLFVMEVTTELTAEVKILVSISIFPSLPYLNLWFEWFLVVAEIWQPRKLPFQR